MTSVLPQTGQLVIELSQPLSMYASSKSSSSVLSSIPAYGASSADVGPSACSPISLTTGIQSLPLATASRPRGKLMAFFHFIHMHMRGRADRAIPMLKGYGDVTDHSNGACFAPVKCQKFQ